VGKGDDNQGINIPRLPQEQIGPAQEADLKGVSPQL
jgi:hypothetical protein